MPLSCVCGFLFFDFWHCVLSQFLGIRVIFEWWKGTSTRMCLCFRWKNHRRKVAHPSSRDNLALTKSFLDPCLIFHRGGESPPPGRRDHWPLWRGPEPVPRASFCVTEHNCRSTPLLDFGMINWYGGILNSMPKMSSCTQKWTKSKTLLFKSHSSAAQDILCKCWVISSLDFNTLCSSEGRF